MSDALRLRVRAGWLALVIAMALTPLHAQQGRRGEGATGNRTIAGVVISATTGRPIENAEVTLRESEESRTSSGVSMETSTDTEGRFSFTGLPDGQFSVRASHRGFIAAALDEHEGYSTAIVTGPGLVTTGIRFPLSPQGVIYGVVTEDSGDPVPHSQVNLYRRDNRTGVEKTVRAGSATTDDLGHYEFPRLTPGNYYVAVIARPWYATHRNPQVGQDGSVNDPPRSPLDVAYPTTYYPEATDAEGAAPIAVKAGERVAINIGMHAVPAVQLKLPAQSSRQRGFDAGELQQDVFGNEERMQASPMIVNMGNGEEGSQSATMILSGIAPGQYTLTSPGRDGAGYAVDATGETAVVRPLDTGASVDITGVVAMADGESLPSSLSLSLQPAAGAAQVDSTIERALERGGSGLVASVDAKGNFQFHGVTPGEYTLHLFASGMAVGTVSMTSSGATVNGNQIRTGTAPVMLAAMLATSRAGVRGYAQKDGKAASGAMVVLAPVDAGGKALDRPELFRRDQSNSDGSFLFSQVLPGRYVVVAIEDGWGLEWARPEVIGPYLAEGVKMEMPAKSGDIRLKDAVEVQSK